MLGSCILSNVHDNIIVTPSVGESFINGAFIGVRSDQIGCHIVFPVGKLEGLRFMCYFQFKMWWMTQRMGSSVERHLQTFCHRDRKKMLDMLNCFGWCTWDAFYTDVTSKGDKQGLESLEKCGIPPKFVIIDDGCQSAGMDLISVESKADNTTNFPNRLTHIKREPQISERGKRRPQGRGSSNGTSPYCTKIKDKHALKYVYVWHAITGYWGGVRHGVSKIEHYESKLAYPISSPGVKSNEPYDALDNITTNSLGLVNHEKVLNFYNELHSYLASAGINGVKVDVQNILQTLGAGNGGIARLARKYHQAS